MKSNCASPAGRSFSILPWHEMKASILSHKHLLTQKATLWICYLTTSTAPGRTLGSLPIIETLAANEPSMLKTTHSIPRGKTVRKASALVWSPLREKSDIKKDPAQRGDALLQPSRWEFYKCQLNACKLSLLRQPWEHDHFWYITSNLQGPIDLLDNHFDGVDPHGKLFAFGDGVGHSATAVGHVCV